MSVEPGKIIEVRPKWMDGWGNRPGFEVLVTPYDERQGIWEERDGYYHSQIGDIIHRMYTNGRPNQGFGGAHFSLNMRDGSTREFDGAWSSSAFSVSVMYPDKPGVECSVTDEHEVWLRGYTFAARDVSVEGLLRWWQTHQFDIDWGIALVKLHYGFVSVEPTKGSYVKSDSCEPIQVLRVLLPSSMRLGAITPQAWIEKFLAEYKSILQAVETDNKEISATK